MGCSSSRSKQRHEDEIKQPECSIRPFLPIEELKFSISVSRFQINFLTSKLIPSIKNKNFDSPERKKALKDATDLLSELEEYVNKQEKDLKKLQEEEELEKLQKDGE